MHEKRKKFNVGVIEKSNSKRCSLVRLLATAQNNTKDESIEKTVGSLEYMSGTDILDKEMQGNNILAVTASGNTLGSVFPSKEIQDIALAEVDRCNKRNLCDELGIVYENIDDVSWKEIIDIIEKEKKPKKGKFLSKVIRRGV